MANVVVSKQKSSAIVVAGLMGVGGLALVFLGLKKTAPAGVPPGGTYDELGPLAPLQPGEKITDLALSNIMGAGTNSASPGQIINVGTPTCSYVGPGRRFYTYVRIVQNQNQQLVTVAGSGVAGVGVPPSTGSSVQLVASNQPQPPECNNGTPGAVMCVVPWPGVKPTPVCGAPVSFGNPPAAAAAAWLVLEVYQDSQASGKAADADGYSAPTCNPRIAVARKIFKNFTYTH